MAVGVQGDDGAARSRIDSIRLTLADGRRGVIPFADLPEIGDLSNLWSIELPNPRAVMLRNPAAQSFARAAVRLSRMWVPSNH